ncbi:MAG: alpha/beta fold hydrolase [Nannocystales bacterium]
MVAFVAAALDLSCNVADHRAARALATLGPDGLQILLVLPRQAAATRTSMQHRGHTPPFLEPDGSLTPGSIAEVVSMRLGGLDQWVMIRGHDCGNPPLIVLHGGPGFSETRLFRHHNGALERDFTVVYWDQRGTAKSYDETIPRSSMTVEQFIRDLDELVDEVRRRLNQKKVTLFGHSWGSVLGVLYASRFPAKVASYVGSGQIGDWPDAEARSYAYAVEEAERRQDRRALRELREIGAPPYGVDELWRERTCLQRFEGKLGVKPLWNLARVVLAGPEYTLGDLPRLLHGFRFSLEAMWPEVSRIDLTKLVPSLKIPTFFFLGRHDRWVPAENSTAFIDGLRAPSKTLLWFENSGHEPFVDEPARFNASMVERVRPVSLESSR